MLAISHFMSEFADLIYALCRPEIDRKWTKGQAGGNGIGKLWRLECEGMRGIDPLLPIAQRDSMTAIESLPVIAAYH